MGGLAQLSDDDLVIRLQRAACAYFIDNANPVTGLIADISIHRARL